MNHPMKLVSTACLLGLASYAFVSCGGSENGGNSSSSNGGGSSHSSKSSKNGGPTDSTRKALILSKSTFTNNVPDPASFVILRPKDDTGEAWTEEVFVAPPALQTFGTGSAEGHPLVLCKLSTSTRTKTNDEGEEEEITYYEMDGSPMVPESSLADGWSLTEFSGDVEWSRRSDGSLIPKAYELKGGNVFHKCMWWEPAFGEPGILTISANMPYLQIYRRGADGWSAETLWCDLVGSREQRYRDIEIGDVDGDGQDELVLATHDNGAIYVLEQTENGLVAQEVHRWEESIFAHEVEIGDVDGDGKPEFFTTPSEPNRSDGLPQAGWIDMYRHDADTGEYTRINVDELTDRHAKEIMVADYDGDGVCELYSALEAKGTKDQVNGVRRYIWDAAAQTMKVDVTVDTDGLAARFLVLADTDGDGVNEILSSTESSGVFKLWLGEGEVGEDGQPGEPVWKKRKIVPSYMSGGFEHAMYAFDWDGDGRDEIFLHGDDQQKLNVFRYNEVSQGYKPKPIANWKDGGNYFVWNIMPLPAGK